MPFLTSARARRLIGCGEAYHLLSFPPARIGNRLNIRPRQPHPLPAAEQRQHHQPPLVRSHAGIEAELSRKWTLQNPHLIAGLEPGALGQLDQPLALALTQVIDDLISDARRPDTVHDQTDDTDAPASG